MAAPFTAFLDRDGVFNPDPPFGLRSPARLRLLPGAAAALARLNRAGVRTCLVTNQPWVGVLSATPGMVHRVHARLAQLLAQEGARLDRVEVAFAPPFLGGLPRRFPGRFHALRRRKPMPGMLEDAARAWAQAGESFDRGRAVMVGDTMRDAGAAHAFGIPCILLSTTHSEPELRAALHAARLGVHRILPDFAAAADEILRMAQG